MLRAARTLAGVLALASAAAPLAGCGAVRRRPPAPASRFVAWPAAVPAGRGPAFRPPARGAAVEQARAIGRLRCTAGAGAGARTLAHVELFAAGEVVPVPPGIGIALPLARAGAYVRGGRCSYSVRTTEPTGLLELRPGARLTLGDLFAIWGQPLSRTRLGAFRGHVRAYLGGRPWPRDPRALPLSAGAVIVLEIGPFVPPHASYRYPPRR